MKHTPEQLAEIDRQQRKAWESENYRHQHSRSDMTRARNAVRKLPKQPCEVCGTPAEAHHEDITRTIRDHWTFAGSVACITPDFMLWRGPCSRRPQQALPLHRSRLSLDGTGPPQRPASCVPALCGEARPMVRTRRG